MDNKINRLPGISEIARKSGIVFSHGEGEFLFDSDGIKYLDFGSGNMAVPFGHSNGYILEKTQKALGKVWNVQDFMTEDKKRSLDEVLDFLPDYLTDVVFHTSGTEGVESLRRAVISAKKRYAFIVFQKAFHGYTLGSRNLGPSLLKGYGPLPGNTIYVPPPECKKCMASKNPETCDTECFRMFTQAIETQAAQLPAAFLFEPIMGAAGVVMPPKKYYDRAIQYCKENDILIACDEILTGLGRTGKKFAFEHYDIEPDIIVFAKGLGNGLPVICVAGKKEIMCSEPYCEDGWNTTSFGGNPISWSAAGATLSYYKENISRLGIREKEDILKIAFEGLQNKYPDLIEARGIGLLWALEFKGFNDNFIVGNEFAFNLLKNRVRINDSFNMVRFTPPLNISAENLIEGLDIIVKTATETIDNYQKEIRK
ncbi:aspartate aminotransferase family protein [bacterium]|nr:aspartate aminotransferase family protein [bacterium]